MGNITGSYNATTGVLTLTSAGPTATLAQWQAALDSVKYTDTAVTPNISTRTISFTAVDGNGTTGNTATRTVTVADTDQTPIVTTSSGSDNYYTLSATPVTVDSSVTVSDRDISSTSPVIRNMRQSIDGLAALVPKTYYFSTTTYGLIIS